MLPRDGKPSTVVPQVLVQTGPAELVITSGAPEFAPVQGTSLLSMTNADHAVFMDPSNNRYYILVSGPLVRCRAVDRAVGVCARQAAAADFRAHRPA